MTKWNTVTPKVCDLCETPIIGTFVHGKLWSQSDRWAIMCPACHKQEGAGFGEGLGQRYARIYDGSWIKVQG